MQEPLTEELLQELLDAPEPRAYLGMHEGDMVSRSLSEYLHELLRAHDMRRVDVIRRAGLNSTFGYQIFEGQRHAGRDKLLQIAFAMGLSLREANRLLQAAQHNELYCKDRRDAIIIFCIDHGYSLQRAEEELYRFGEDTIAHER